MWLAVTIFVGILPKALIGVLPIMCEVCYLGGGVLPLKPRCATWSGVLPLKPRCATWGGCGILPLKPRCATWGGVVYYH